MHPGGRKVAKRLSLQRRKSNILQKCSGNVDKELTVLSQNAEVANGEENKIGGEIQRSWISQECTAIVEGGDGEKAKVELRRLKEAGDAFPDERRKLFDQLTEEQVLKKLRRCSRRQCQGTSSGVDI